MDPPIEEVLDFQIDPSHNVRRTDPETSYRAAFANSGQRLNQRWHCYMAIVGSRYVGLIDAQVSERTGIALNSANKRRGELAEKGLVVDSGRRRLTPAHCEAIVWVAREYL